MNGFILSKTDMRTIIQRLLFPFLLLAVGPLQAQTVKSIAVSAQASYTDHISLGEDSRDTDVMVKFVFDEGKNTLTVSVLSYRSLFVFREASRYSSVVSGCSLHPDKLPYVVSAAPDSKFSISRELKKSLPRPLCQYVFRRWIEVDGLQAVPMEYKMVNDYIEQRFDIQPKRSTVSVTLRDLYLLEPKGNKYELLLGRDLNTRYVIRILRNPCFGLEDQVAAARKNLEDIKGAYATFSKTYGSGEVSSEEALQTFNDTQKALVAQFPVRQCTAPACPDMKDAVEQYNHYVDSLKLIRCEVKLPDPGDLADVKELDPKMLYAQARQLDKAVARWLVSKDQLERQDLLQQCRDIIEDMDSILEQGRAVTPEEQQALKVYRQAVQYFKKTCKQ